MSLTRYSIAIPTILALIVISLASLHPLPTHLTDSLPFPPGFSPDLRRNDPAMFCWNLWWIDRWIAGDHPLFDCRKLHHPFGIDLKFHTLSPANGILAAPVTRHLSPVAAHNGLLVFHALLTTAAMYLLARRQNIGRLASILAAAVFCWWPARRIHSVIHLNLASTGWMLMTIVTFLQALHSRNRIWFALSLVCFILTGTSSWHLLQQLVMLLPVFALLGPIHPAPLKRRLVYLGMLLVLGLLILSPLIAPFTEKNPDFVSADGLEEQRFSIRPAALLTPPVGHPVYDGWIYPPTNNPADTIVENTGFAGFGLLLLLIFGLVKGDTRERWMMIAGSIFALLAFGPVLLAGNVRIPMPFALLDSLPVLSFSRTPGRFLIAAGLLWSLAAGCMLNRCLKISTIAGGFLGCLLILDFLPGKIGLIPLETLPDYQRPELQDREGILEIPNDWSNPALMLGQTIHGSPITTGFSARMPSTVFDRIRGIPLLSDLSDPKLAAGAFERLTIIDLIRFRNLLAVDTLIFHSSFCEPPRKPANLLFQNLDTVPITVSGDPALPDVILDLAGLTDRLPEPEIYLLDRWSGPEDWNDGSGDVYWGLYPSARFRLTGVAGAVVIRFEALAACRMDSAPVMATLRCDTRMIGSLELQESEGWQKVSFDFEPETGIIGDGFGNPYEDLIMEFSSGTAPVDCPDTDRNRSDDRRLLAVAVRRVSISTVPASGASTGGIP